ncbi:RNA polymerase I-specific transcription-initiation factor [Ceratobasidium sp. AG-Ba]|nr:RNA polymerase I-specific transcription-initiation factor [Ceratobasidium sp. AG-Ba]
MNNLSPDLDPAMKPPAHVASTKLLADHHTRYHLKQMPIVSRESSESRKRRLELDEPAKPGRPVAPHTKSLKRDESFRKDMYLVFVKNALKERLKGNSEPFYELVGQFSPAKLAESGGSSATQLRSWIAALSHVVSSFERSHAPLVEAVLATPWVTLDDAFTAAYTNFVGMLVSARPEYLSVVLGRCVQGFTYPTEPFTGTNPDSSTCAPTYDQFPLSPQKTYDAILSLIVERAQQIDVEIQVELEDLDEEDDGDPVDIFNLDGFDTAVGEEDHLQDGDEDEDDLADGLSDISSDDGDLAEHDIVEGPANVAHIQDMVGKLDAVLSLVFEHLAAIPSEPLSFYSWSPTTSTPATPERQFEMRSSQLWILIAIFKRTIVKTHKSRYTQFLLFWYSSLHPDFTDVFLGVLMDRLMDTTLPDMARVGAASYVASFISRAKHVDTPNARGVVGVLCNYLRDAVDDIEEQEAQDPSFTPVVSRHALFYAIAQAVFLIYCFRWRELGEDPDVLLAEGDDGPPKTWMPELLVVQRAISCALNPLKICATNVVQQFTRVSNSTGFVYCFSIVESNRRSDLATTATPAPQAGTRLKIDPKHAKLTRDPTLEIDLNAFFPFDPYKLPMSHKYVDDVYRDWASVALEEDAESDEDEEAEEIGDTVQDGRGHSPNPDEEDEESDEDSQVGRSSPEPEGIPIPGSATDLLDATFGGMSISPGASRR